MKYYICYMVKYTWTTVITQMFHFHGLLYIYFNFMSTSTSAVVLISTLCILFLSTLMVVVLMTTWKTLSTPWTGVALLRRSYRVWISPWWCPWLFIHFLNIQIVNLTLSCNQKLCSEKKYLDKLDNLNIGNLLKDMSSQFCWM